MNAIVVDGVEKRFGRGGRAVHALRGVTLAVASGEIYGLLGRNGAGKTTLVKILLDLVRPTRGCTSLNGIASAHHRARQNVGYLPEDHRFPLYQTASTAIAFYGRLSGLSLRECRARTPRLLELVSLTNAEHKRVRTFSKGMKQRLGLAQALVHDPDILFLDEPTDGVDPAGRAEIRDVLLRLRGEGKTIFLNSHLLSEVEQLCDRVGILDDGSLVREGTIAQLTATELVYRFEVAAEPSTDVVARIREHAVSWTSHAATTFEVGLDSEAALDRIVDLLREGGVGLRHLSGKRLSLEQVFLAAIDKPGGGRP
jgi:ABC-2 type transport system ATP-binding protein